MSVPEEVKWCGRILLILLVALGMGCEERLTELPKPLQKSARQQYQRSLEKEYGAIISQTYERKARAALRDSVLIQPPYEEYGRVDSFRMEAMSYRLSLEWGQALRVEWGSEVPLLVEAFPADRLEKPGYQSERGDTAAWIEVPYDGDFVLRVQPEWRHAGDYRLRILVEGAYDFPVEGRDNRAIWSKWGDPRDGGKRKHEGIDIFAKRGTPVRAVAEGRVNRVTNGGRGGKTVWLSDERNGYNWYYAHLDSQYVEAGTWVDQGAILGTVGNTGNAAKTKPHLHFGMYLNGRGARDPEPFVRYYKTRFPNLVASAAWAGRYARVRSSTSTLRTQPARRSEPKETLLRGTRLRILGATGSYLRVRTPGGRVGFVTASTVRPDEP